MTKTTTNNNHKTSVSNAQNQEKKESAKDYSKEIESLKKDNNELNAKLEQLIQMFSTFNQSTSKNEEKAKSTEKEVSVKYSYDYDDVPNEVSPNKQISVMSLSYGSLNLAEEEGGRAVLKFSKYGETKPVLYSKLMNIVNSNRRFAETGRFYILDKDAVYYLGLSEYYKNILPKDIIDNVMDYSPNVINSIISASDDYQKQTIARIICDRVYNNEDVDLNKVNLIGKACNVDIMNKVEEMRSFSNQNT